MKVGDNIKSKIVEVQGLRGLAVLMVVFFHAQLDFASYGYLGVDLFFVISGYIVTRSYFARKESGKFSTIDFYKRRFFRLYPAFLFVTVVTSCLSFIIQDHFEFRENALFFSRGNY